jgi:hypothetical protein
MRSLTAGTVAAMAAEQQRYVHLLDLYLSGEMVRFTDDVTDAVIGANTYQALGHFLDFQHDGDGDGLDINSMTVTLSGVDQAAISLALQREFVGRRMVVWRCYVDSAGVLQQPFALFDGRCDGPGMDDNPEDGTCVVQLKAASHFIDFERVRGRLTNTESQRQHFPNDKVLEFVSQLAKDLQWGVK